MENDRLENRYDNLSKQNYEELFSNRTVWLVDDTSVNGATRDEDSVSRPLNGAICVFNPRTGQLFLKVIQPLDWTDQKTAEEVAALIGSLPVEEQPREVIVLRKGVLGPIALRLRHFADIVVKGSRAMQVRNDEVELVLKSTDKATKGHEVWPTLSEAEWTQCEVALKDLIFASCGDQNKPSEISGSVLDILEKAAI